MFSIISVTVDDDGELVHDPSLGVRNDAGSQWRFQPAAGSISLLKEPDVGALEEVKGMATALVILKGDERAIVEMENLSRLMNPENFSIAPNC